MSFWKAASEVPPDLKQRLSLIPGSLSTISNDLFQDRSTDVRFKHLLKSNGQYTPYQVLFTANELSVKDVNLGVVVEQIAFEAGVSIIDVSYLPTSDGSFGLVVAYNHGSPQTGCLVRLIRLQMDDGLQVVYKLAIPYKVSAISVIIADDEEKPRQLSARMVKWDNVVAVGTHFGHGFVVHLPIEEDWTISADPVVKGLTDATRSFHKSDTFVYRVRDGSQGEMRLPLRDTYVSAIGYIARSCVLMFGFSFGGLIQVAITDGGEITCNSIVSTSPVRHIVGLLPHDDPNMHIWFFVTYGSAEKGLKMGLFEGFFDVVKGQENVPALDRDFLNPMFVVKFVEKFPVGCRWITAQALVRERNGGREESDESMNVTLNDTDMDYSQLFYAFRTPQDDIMCGIFDLNTYYFKRLLQCAYTDSTIAKQCAFLSIAAGPRDMPVDTDSITNMIVDPNQMSRFQFAEDPEQQLYASMINLRCIHVGSTTATFKLALPSLPAQVLDRVYEDLAFHRNAHTAVRSLTAVGLMPPFATQERQTELGVVLVCAVLYGKLRSILRVINETDEEEWPSLRKVSEWLSDESKRTRNNIDAMVSLLFSEIRGMSAEQNKQLNQIDKVANAAKKIYAVIHRLFSAWQKDNAIPQGISAEVEVHFVAGKNLASYVKCITNLCRAGYLPMGVQKREERRELEEGVAERRNAHRLNRSPRPLFIDRVVQKMQNCTPNEPLWLDQSASEWYPPALHNALPLLLPWTVPDKLKKDFIVYFFFDLVIATRQFGFGKERHVYDVLPVFVSNLLEGVLDISADAVSDVFHHWTNESLPVRATESLPVLKPNPGVEDANSKITVLMRNDEKLSGEDEKQLQELCAGVPFGKYRWQLYLIGQGRFEEVQMLEAVSESRNNFERLFAQAMPGVRRLRQHANKWQNSLTSAPALPGEVLLKIKEFDPASKEAAPSGPKFNPKTPVALFKRMRRTPAAQVVPEEEMTPDAKRKKIDQDVSALCTPPMPNLQPDQLEKVAEILRTPTSRRVRAAAAVENQTGICVTPENTVPPPQPTSILRTPIRKMASPARANRLRWDPEFVEPSLDSTGIESSKDDEEMDETEDATEDANETLEVAMEEQEERFEDSVVEEQEDEEVEVLEKSEEAQEEQKVEEQEEDVEELEKSEEIQEELEKLEEEQEEENQEDDDNFEMAPVPQEDEEKSFPAIKLVDYSITDSTIMETPPRSSQTAVVTLNSRCWMDSDGIEHSFEQQEEEKSENPMEDVEKSFEEQEKEEEAVEQQEDEKIGEYQDATQSFAIDPPVARDRSFVEVSAVEARVDMDVAEGLGETFVIASPQRRWKDAEVEEAQENKTEMVQEDTVDEAIEEMEEDVGEVEEHQRKEEEKEPEPELLVVKKSPGRPRKASSTSSVKVESSRRPSSRRSVSNSVAPAAVLKKTVEKKQDAEEDKEEESVEPKTAPKSVSPPKEVVEEKSARRSSRGRSVPTAVPVAVDPEAPQEEEPQSMRRSARKSPSRARSASETNAKKPAAARLLFPAKKLEDVTEKTAKEDAAPVPSVEATPNKRGHPVRKVVPTLPRVTRSSSRDLAPKPEEKVSSVVASFRARMAKAREEAGMGTSVSTRKRTASDSGVSSTSAKIPVIVPATVDEEPVAAPAPKRRSISVSEEAPSRRRSNSRSRAVAQPTIPEEPAPAVTRSPARRARKASESSDVPKPVRSSSRSRALKPIEAAVPEPLAPRRTPSRSKKEASAEPEPAAPAPKRGKSPARAVHDTEITQVKKSPGRPRKGSSTSAEAEPVDVEPVRKSSSRRSVNNAVLPPVAATPTPRRGAKK